MSEHVRPNVLYKRMKVAERRYQILRDAINGILVHSDIHIDDVVELREALQKAVDAPKEVVVPRKFRDTLNTPPTPTSAR